MQLQEVVEDQAFSPTLIAGALRTTKAEIAGTLGAQPGRALADHANPGAEDADPASGDGGDSSPCRGLHRLLCARGVCLVPLRGPAGFRRAHA